MANSKINFAGLVKISGNQWDAYVSAKTDGIGKIIFADITTEDHVGKYIYANGIEYKVADSSAFADLEARVKSLEDWKTIVDSSIATLDSSVSTLEEWKVVVDASQASQDASISDHQIRIVNLENASNALGQRIADVSQNVIDISTYVHQTVNASIDVIHTKDTEQDSSISDISSRLASVSITAADGNISVNGSSISVENGKYVNVTATNNTLTVGLADSSIQDGGSSEGHDKLATKGYVDEQVAILEQALVFKGEVTAETAEGLLTTAATQAGWTYIATGNAFDYNSKHIEAGDLVIVTSDAAAGTPSSIVVVERNLDGAVTASAALDNDYVILGSGNQAVKVSTIEVNALLTAIENANSAIQGVIANSSTTNFIDASAAINSSIVTVTVGAKVITLNDASQGTHGLADAADVYTELTKVEEIIAAANNKIADSVGLDENYNPGWSTVSGIDSTKSYREVIEELHGQVAGNVVNTIGGAHGDISLSTSSTTGDVSFGMDSSVLVGKVQGWSELTIKVDNIDASLADLSTNVIPGLNTSINTLEDKVEDISNFIHDSSFVNTITAESAMTGATSSYVAVKADASKGDVTLSSEVLLATYSITSGTAATPTGLATDALVKDYVADQIAWAVITD